MKTRSSRWARSAQLLAQGSSENSELRVFGIRRTRNSDVWELGVQDDDMNSQAAPKFRFPRYARARCWCLA
eukprot:9951458-Alexandrium_andersonii.AAC.1